MEKINYSWDTCDTTFDVLNHKFIKKVIVDLYKDRIDDNISYDIDLSDIRDFVRVVFEDKDLYHDFTLLLKDKYARLAKWTFSQKQIFAALTSISYMKHALDCLPILSIDQLNKKLIDILDYDEHLQEESEQRRRMKILKASIPLLDSDWYEISNFVSREDIIKENIEFVSHDMNDDSIFPFTAGLVKEDEEELWSMLSEYYIMFPDGTPLYDSTNEAVRLVNLEKVIIWRNELFFKTVYAPQFFNKDWEALSDGEWSFIDNVFLFSRFEAKELAMVTSSAHDNPYYIDFETKDPLYVTYGDVKIWLIRNLNVSDKIEYEWKKYYRALVDGNRSYLVDENLEVLLSDDKEPALYVVWNFIIPKKIMEEIEEV